MKTRLYPPIIATCICLALVGCSSRRSVKSELSDPGAQLRRDEAFSVAIAQAGGSPIEFGPRERKQAIDSLRSQLESRSLAVVEDSSKAGFLVTFGTYVESEKEHYATVFPERHVHAYSTPRGLNTPLGPVVTGHDTHIVETGTSAGIIAFEDADRVFVIDVTDTKSGELVWRGYTRRGSDRLDVKLIEKEISRIVEAMPLSATNQESPYPNVNHDDPV